MVIPGFNASFGQLKAYFGLQQTPSAYTTSPSRAHLSAEEVDDALGDEVVPVTIAGQSKRIRGSESEGPVKKKVRTGSDHERRLTGDYETPATAKPIMVPQAGEPRPSTPRPVEKKTMPQTKFSYRGGIKPRDTLNTSLHGAAKPATRKPDPFYPKQQTTEPLATARSVGSNVAVGRTYHTGQRGRPGADGFDSPPTAKRQKIGHANGTIDRSSQPIHITEDDSQQLVRAASQSKAKYKDNDFNREFRESDGLAGGYLKPHKPRKRKDRDTSSSQAASVSGSEVEVVSRRSSAQPGSRHSPMVVVDASEGKQQGLMPAPIRRRIEQPESPGPSGTQSRPPINLGVGVDDYETQSERLQSERSTKANAQRDAPGIAKQRQRQTNGIERDSPAQQSTANGGSRAGDLRAGTSGLNGADRGSGSPSVHAQAAAMDRATKRLEDAEVASDNSRNRFVREDQSQQPPLKAKQRMQATSERPVSRGSMHSDSPDELQGSTNVKSAAAPRATIGRGKERPISPQDAPASKSKIKTGSISHLSHRKSSDSDGTSPCQLRAFYSSAGDFFGDLELKYDEAEDRLDLYQDEIPVPWPGKRMFLGLGPFDLKQVYYGDGNPRVVSYGSGKTCLAFSDLGHMDRFLSWIPTISDRFKLHKVDGDLIDVRFKNVSHEIRAARERDQKEAERDRRRLEGLKKAREGVDDEDEVIRYEDSDGEQRAPKRRSLMQAESEGTPLEKALRQAQTDKQARNTSRVQEGTTSRYFSSQEPRRSGRQSKPVKQRTPTPEPPKWSQIHKPKRWSQPVTYPAQGLRRVTVDFDDIHRLDEGEFLNDNLVTFALRQLEEQMNPELKDQVHWFSSFFYTTLSTKNHKKVFNYDGVKRWTKNKDLLTTPYVVVPICQDLHWYVCIICNLDKLNRKPLGVEDAKPGTEEPKSSQAPEVKDGEDTVEVVSVAEPVGKSMNQITDGVKKQSLSDKSGESSRQASPGGVFSFGEDGKAGDAEDDDEIKVATKPAAACKGKKRPPTRTWNSEAPLIITLDSLGNTHGAELRNLKDYVCHEAEAKRGIKVEREAMQGLTAKGLPEQTNFCDCGVYVVGYMERFVQDPAKFVEKVASRQLDREQDFASFDPSAKREQIRNALLELQEEQELERQGIKKEKAVDSAVVKNEGEATATKRESPDKAPKKPPRPMKEVLAQGQEATRTSNQPPKSADASAKHAKQASPVKTSPRPSRQATPNKEEEDELEMSVPRSLPQSKASSRLTSSAGLPPPKKAGPFEDESESEDDDEMLDHGDNNDGGGLPLESSQPTAPVGSSEPLLNELEKHNNDGLLTPRRKQIDVKQLETDDDNAVRVSVNGTRKPKPRDRESERSVVIIDDSQESIAPRPAEIQDSQEQSPAHRVLKETAGRRYWKFDD